MTAAVGEEMVILDQDSGTYFGLNSVGMDIWRLIESGRPIHEIAESVAGDYGMSVAECASDVTVFIDSLLAAGLVRQGPGTG